MQSGSTGSELLPCSSKDGAMVRCCLCVPSSAVSTCMVPIEISSLDERVEGNCPRSLARLPRYCGIRWQSEPVKAVPFEVGVFCELKFWNLGRWLVHRQHIAHYGSLLQSRNEDPQIIHFSMSNRPSVLTGGRNLRAWIHSTPACCNISLHPTLETHAFPISILPPAGCSPFLAVPTPIATVFHCTAVTSIHCQLSPPQKVFAVAQRLPRILLSAFSRCHQRALASPARVCIAISSLRLTNLRRSAIVCTNCFRSHASTKRYGYLSCSTLCILQAFANDDIGPTLSFRPTAHAMDTDPLFA